MKVTAERIPEARVVLEVEIDDERLQRSLDQAYRRLAPRTRVPGFRPGKAPRPLVERALGHDRLLQEAVDRLLPEAYEEAVQAQGLDPIAAPELEVLQMEPVRFKATVPLQPEVGLGAYQSLSMKREAVEITEEQIQAALLEIRRRHAILEPVDRPLQYNDRLTVDIRAEVDGRLVLNQDGAEVHLREGMTLAVPGLAEGLVGRSAGQNQQIEVQVPASYADGEVAGKTVRFTVNLRDIRQEILPEANDDLAAEVGDFASFGALRDRVASDLQARASEQVNAAFQQAVLDAVVAGAQAEYPPVLVEQEIDHLLEEMARRQGRSAEDYVSALGQEAPQLREQLRAEAIQRVVRGLVLTEAAKLEEIDVTAAEGDAEIARLVGDGPEAAQLRTVFESEGGRRAVERNLVTSRILERLSAIAITNAESEGGAAGAAREPAEPGGASPKDDPDPGRDSDPQASA